MYRVYNFLNALFLKTAYATFDAKPLETDGKLVTTITTGFATIYALLSKIVPWVAVIMIAVTLFKIITGDDKQVQASKKQLIWIAVGLVGFFLAKPIVEAIQTAFGI